MQLIHILCHDATDTHMSKKKYFVMTNTYGRKNVFYHDTSDV